MGQLLTTSSVPQGQRLAYWTDMICDEYVQLACDALQRYDYIASNQSHSHAHL